MTADQRQLINTVFILLINFAESNVILHDVQIHLLSYFTCIRSIPITPVEVVALQKMFLYLTRFLSQTFFYI